MQQTGLRPLGFGEILDGAFVLYRRDFAAFLALSALPVTPLLALRLALALSGARFDARAGFALDLVGIALGTLAMGALIVATSDAYHGIPVDRRSAFARARAHYGRLLATVVAMRLMVFLGFLLLIVPGVIAMVRFFAVEQVVMLEGTTSAAARERSTALAEGAFGRVLGMIGVIAVLTLLPTFTGGFLRGVAGNGGAPPNPYMMGVFTLAFQILALPVSTAAYTLLYFDRRVRAEALDVEVAVRNLVPA